MNDIVTQPLVLKKKSKSSRFASWGCEGNSFFDKFLRSVYIFLLFAINFVMFIYSINAKVVENGVFNQGVLVILGGVFVISFMLIMFCAFSKKVQNGVCALFTMIFVAVFFYQFAEFNVDNFVETWLNKKASWLTFICFVPSCWLVGFLVGVLVFFLFWNRFGLMFVTLVLLSGFLLGLKKNEDIKNKEAQYAIVKDIAVGVGKKRDDSIVYFMIPKFPSYQFLGGIRNTSFRELRNLMIGFFATNDFEIYPNAFVETNKTEDNIIDIFNQVDYLSSTSKNRGFSEYDNDWNFIHGGLNYYLLDENRLYEFLSKKGYGVSIYPMPGFNTCVVSGGFETDRCTIKGYKTIELWDKNASLEQNVYTLLTEWVLNLKQRDMKSIAKQLVNKSAIKGYKVTAENRRVSIEGAPYLFDEVSKHVKADRGGQVYMVYVDLPSDIFIYDEYCNIKPREQWVALKDNSLYSVGIDEKRQAYVDQSKCLIGKMQEFMDELRESGKISKTDVFVQGVSSIRELGVMTGGRYGNFVTDRLVSLGIRKAKKPKFLINANICLASDFTKSLIRFQDYCYSVDNMNYTENEAMNLKKNLINNSVIRGGKITSIAVNYKDWYESFKQNSLDFQKKVKRIEEERLKKEKEEFERVEREKKQKEQEKVYNEVRTKNISQANIFVPTDEMVVEAEHVIVEDIVEEVNVDKEKAENIENVEIEKTENVDKEKTENVENEKIEAGLGEILSEKNQKEEIKEKIDEIINGDEKVSVEVKEVVADVVKEISIEDVEAIKDVVGQDDEGLKVIQEELLKTPQDLEVEKQEKQVLDELQNKATEDVDDDEVDLELDF